MRDGSNKINGNNRRMHPKNTSKRNGVSWHKHGKYWFAYWMDSETNRRRTRNFHTYLYENEEAAYNEACKFRDEKDKENGCTNGQRPKRKIEDVL